MTDTLTPGSEWLLPVLKIGQSYSDPHYRSVHLSAGVQIFLSEQTIDTLIPASRITDLEAEVARLTDTLEMIEKFSDDSTSVEWAKKALAERGPADD